MDELQAPLEIMCEIARDDLTLQQIADKAFGLFGNPIVIMDMNRMPLVYTRSVEIQDSRWNLDIVQGVQPQNSVTQLQEIRQIQNASLSSGMPIYVNDNEVPYPRYVKMLQDSFGQPIGAVILFGILRPLTEQDGQLLELLSTYIVIQTRRERYSFQTNDRAFENLLIKLLDGTLNSELQIDRWMKRLEWKPGPCRYVMVMQMDTRPAESVPIESIMETLSNTPNCRSVIYDSGIVVVICMDVAVADWKEEHRIQGYLTDWNMVAGVSRMLTSFSELREGYLEARTALRLGKRLGQRTRLFPYNYFSVFHLIENLPRGVDIRRFCDDKILRLEKSDRSEGKELLATLHTYLNFSKSLSKTAEMLYIHRNTVRYRINKCMEIMQTNLEDGDEIFGFILSLRILAYEKDVQEQKECLQHEP